MREAADLEKLLVKDLKAELKELGLSVSGKKAELVSRLMEHESAEANKSEEKKSESEEKKSESDEKNASEGHIDSGNKSGSEDKKSESDRVDAANMDKAADSDSQVGDKGTDAEEGGKNSDQVGDEDEVDEQDKSKKRPAGVTEEIHSTKRVKPDTSGAAKGGANNKSAMSDSDTIKIVNFVRPLQKRRLEELLARTGSVNQFWMDKIKTHCFVTYSSAAEARATANALDGVVWPPETGRALGVSFLTRDEADADIARQSSPSAPVVPTPAQQAAGHAANPQQIQQAPQKEMVETAQPPVAEMEVEEFGPSLDELFRKTKTKPAIYWLPLTEEQIAKKKVSQAAK